MKVLNHPFFKRKTILFLLISILLCPSIIGQISNDIDILIKNKVLVETEKSGKEKALISKNTYDINGNVLEWDFNRSPIIYRSVFDENQNQIWTLMVDRKNPTRVDSISMEETMQMQAPEYKEKLDVNGRLVSKYNENEVFYYTYNRAGLLTEEVQFINDKLMVKETLEYNIQGQLIKKVTVDEMMLGAMNSSRDGKEDLTELVETYSYNKKGQLKTLGHYEFNKLWEIDEQVSIEIFYLDNGLIDFANVNTLDLEFLYPIKFSYEYTDNTK